ncbi:unnamed protein product [Leptidea sinapis]|uniref:Uncharacterized protein n=1 Tax=Leptidea sinapis TaxID=189913 RepID=A0A5E4QZQ2_9NEOP|nr:unnamed protein product [Leptidea sinapis]
MVVDEARALRQLSAFVGEVAREEEQNIPLYNYVKTKLIQVGLLSPKHTNLTIGKDSSVHLFTFGMSLLDRKVLPVLSVTNLHLEEELLQAIEISGPPLLEELVPGLVGVHFLYEYTQHRKWIKIN